MEKKLEEFPKDVLFRLALELNIPDILKLCSTNKRINSSVCKNQNFWLKKIMIMFPEVPLDVLKKSKGDRTWSQYYIEDLKMNQTNILKLYNRVEDGIITKDEFERTVRNIPVDELTIDDEGTTLYDYVFEVEDIIGSYEPLNSGQIAIYFSYPEKIVIFGPSASYYRDPDYFGIWSK